MNCIKCRAPLPEGARFCPMCGKKQTPEPRKALKRANGTGTVYKLSGRRRKPWVAAKSKVVIGTFETKTAALQALEKLSGKPISEKYNWTFAEVYTEWKKEHDRKASESTKRIYKTMYPVFAPVNNTAFRLLRTADFQACIDNKPGKSHSFYAKCRQLVSQMSKWAIREEIATTNFGLYLQIPDKKEKEKEIFTKKEIQLLEKDPSETSRIIRMMIHTGVRIGEMFSLKVSDYHETYVIGGEKTDAGRNRVIPIPPSVQGDFQYFVSRAKTDQLLSGYKGNHLPAGFRSDDYYPTLDRLGIKRKSPHSTRHTYASMARASGMQPEVLQRILGHSDYQTTANTYVHTDIDLLVSASEKL